MPKISQLPQTTDPTTSDKIPFVRNGITVHALLSELIELFFTNIPAGSGSPVTRWSENFYDFVASGGVWSGDSYGVNRNASMTAMIIYINGRRISIGAVSARTFTASKDTYIDVLDNLDGTGTLVYTEVSNNAASPALASNSVRVGIIVTGATTIASAGSVNQGEETKVLPIASSIAYAVTDSLGNLICPRDPNRKLLGQRQRVADFTSTSTPAMTDITGLNCPVIIPAGARKIKVSYSARYNKVSAAGGNGYDVQILEDSTVIQMMSQTSAGAEYANVPKLEHIYTPSAGSHTYKLQFAQGAAGTFTVAASATAPASIKIELY